MKIKGSFALGNWKLLTVRATIPATTPIRIPAPRYFPLKKISLADDGFTPFLTCFTWNNILLVSQCLILFRPLNQLCATYNRHSFLVCPGNVDKKGRHYDRYHRRDCSHPKEFLIPFSLSIATIKLSYYAESSNK